MKTSTEPLFTTLSDLHQLYFILYFINFFSLADFATLHTSRAEAHFGNHNRSLPPRNIAGLVGWVLEWQCEGS